VSDATASDLLFRPAGELAGLVRSGEVSARELVQTSLDRIEELNPRLNAFVDVFADEALAAADAVEPGDERPFAGVPIAIKNNRAVEGQRLTFAAEFFGDFVAPYDHNVTRRLKEAGFIVVGSTTLPEYGILPVTEGRRFGPTRNPWDTERTPGGSSGGSAAAVASGMLPLAHGNDGGGSIRIPAACCGVVGHKPTRGLVSGAPATYDAWEGFATNGPMARSVADCALMLEVMAGSEPGDAYYPPPYDGAFVAACVDDPAPLRIGVLREPPVGSLDLELGAIFDAVMETLTRMGHRLEVADAPVAALMGPFETIVLGQSAGYRQIVPPERWEELGALTREVVADGERIGVGAYVQAVAEARRAGAALLDALAPFELVVSPVLTRAAVPLDEFPVEAGRRECWRAYFEWHSYTVPFNVTGQPALSLPCGTTAEGLPVGLQIAGPPGADALVLALAAALERALV
jgi:Asp-tRNA(Asn)/Glu-tRNA(Gln) amidotransferase A subunit family amidase